MEQKETKAKKPYEPPKLVRIKLDAEQAILGTCSTATGSALDSASSGCFDAVKRPCAKRNDTRAIDSGVSS